MMCAYDTGLDTDYWILLVCHAETSDQLKKKLLLLHRVIIQFPAQCCV